MTRSCRRQLKAPPPPLNTSSRADDRYPADDSRAAAPPALAPGRPIAGQRAREHRALTVPTSWKRERRDHDPVPSFPETLSLFTFNPSLSRLTSSHRNLAPSVFCRCKRVSSARGDDIIVCSKLKRKDRLLQMNLLLISFSPAFYFVFWPC